MSSAAQKAGAAPGILFLLPWSVDAIGGVSQVVTNLVRQALTTHQAQPTLLENSPEQQEPLRLERDDGLTLFRFWVRTPLAEPARLRTTLGFLLRLPGTLLRLRGVLASEHVSAVNVHYPSLAAVHFRLLQILGMFHGRLILSFHGLDLRAAAASNGLERAIWRWLLRTADNVVACSHALATDISALEPRCQDRLVVIHNGVDPATLLSPGAASLPAELAGLAYVLNVGTFEHKKGQDVLLTAFATLRRDHPELRLVLVGRATPYLDRLRDSIARLELADSVQIYTDIPHESIAPFFANAQAFCLPSRAEPFGIVILEAALFDVPVVASAVGGIAEIVRNGVDGILVSAESPAELAAAMHATLADMGASRARAAALRERVTERFTWQNAFRRYLDLVQA